MNDASFEVLTTTVVTIHTSTRALSPAPDIDEHHSIVARVARIALNSTFDAR